MRKPFSSLITMGAGMLRRAPDYSSNLCLVAPCGWDFNRGRGRGWESRPLSRFCFALVFKGLRHYSATIARLSPLSGLERGGPQWSRDSIAFNRSRGPLRDYLCPPKIGSIWLFLGGVLGLLPFFFLYIRPKNTPWKSHIDHILSGHRLDE